uniref:Uncharacterized protein n=1 Tax=uncultured marine virus TaxID=186617 RepID=A0A0F7LAC0_9VIRU|nr:hypothetical protein [uncultured marine virus]
MPTSTRAKRKRPSRTRPSTSWPSCTAARLTSSAAPTSRRCSRPGRLESPSRVTDGERRLFAGECCEPTSRRTSENPSRVESRPGRETSPRCVDVD